MIEICLCIHTDNKEYFQFNSKNIIYHLQYNNNIITSTRFLLRRR